jgi:hypothetical protein
MNTNHTVDDHSDETYAQHQSGQAGSVTGDVITLPRPTASPTLRNTEPESVRHVAVNNTNVADSDRQAQSKVSASVGHDQTNIYKMSDSVGQKPENANRDVGHDPDLPARDDRHKLSTYEAGKIFEEADCRVSERTIIRWCNKNKSGKRRLDCAFDTEERKYYINEESVKSVIREERSKGRRAEQYVPDMTGTEPAQMADTDRHVSVDGGQRRTAESDSVGQEQTPQPVVSDTKTEESASHATREGTEREAERRSVSHDEEELRTQLVELRVELAKLEAQAKTKDEMMTFLRQEIDRRGEQLQQDRDTYEKALGWFRDQMETKDRVIERLNRDVRGLLEAPKTHDAQMGDEGEGSVPPSGMPSPAGEAEEDRDGQRQY